MDNKDDIIVISTSVVVIEGDVSMTKSPVTIPVQNGKYWLV